MSNPLFKLLANRGIIFSTVFTSLLFNLHLLNNNSSDKHSSTHTLDDIISYGALIGHPTRHLFSYKYL